MRWIGVGGEWDDTSMSEQARAGWYPDGAGNERYWDGAAWTDQVRSPELLPPAPGASAEKQGAFSKLGSAVKKAAADRQAAKEELAQKHADDEAAAGRLVTSGVFGMSTIEIYEGGYVRVAEGSDRSVQPATINRKTPYEKLRSIKFTPSDEERAASAPSAPSVFAGTVGTAVSGILSGGKNIMKGSVPGLAAAGIAHIASTGSRRSCLTIGTDRAIHTLSNQFSNSLGLKTSDKGHSDVARELEAAGNVLLGVTDLEPESSVAVAPPIASPAAAAGPTTAERLRELAALHKDGILSDEEFAAGKAKLLAGL